MNDARVQLLMIYNMKKNLIMKKFFVVALLMTLSLTLPAEEVSQQQAFMKAQTFMQQRKGGKARSRAATNPSLKQVVMDHQLLYAFNDEEGGFVIVSGDDRTVPILGYSLTGTLDADNIPDNMRSWLRAWEVEIAAMKHSNVAVTRTEYTSLDAIEPLLKTTWYQTAPYNLLTPIYNGNNKELIGQHGATGCVATALAQVMYYHQWPQEATQPVPEYHSVVSDRTHESLLVEGLPATTFKWDKMLLNYSKETPGTEEEQLAVAELMNYCGRAVKMDFHPKESGTTGEFVANAVRRYFGYSKSTHVAFRQDYSIDEWRDLLWNELNNKRPVLFTGSTTQGGHEFVIDGYDGKGLFHVNWGWAGRSDGYYAIGELNPHNTTSTGAAAVNQGYILRQSAIIGMEKSTGTEEVIPEVTDTLYQVRDPNYLYQSDVLNRESLMLENQLFYYSFDLVNGHYYLGWGIKDADGTCMPFVEDETATEVESSKFVSHSFNLYDYPLKDGTYNIYPIAKVANKDGATWNNVGSKNQYFIVDVKDSKPVISYPTKLVITDAYFKNPDVKPFDNDSLFVVVENQGDIDVFMLSSMKFDDTESASESTNSGSKAKSGTRMGDVDLNKRPLSLRPGERETLTYYVRAPKKGNTDVCITNDSKDVIYARKTITINSDIDYYDIQFTDYRLEYSEEGEFNIMGTLKNNDTRDLEYAVMFSLGGMDADTYKDGLKAGSSVVLDKDFFVYLNGKYMDPEELEDIEFSVDIVELVTAGYSHVHNVLKLILKPCTVTTPEGSTPTGIKAIETGEVSNNAAFYDLQGRRIGQKPQQKGLYIKQGKKIVIK